MNLNIMPGPASPRPNRPEGTLLVSSTYFLFGLAAGVVLAVLWGI